ncbi:SdpI family protein [Riemerella columbipharyngis]|uniref:SdpI/YhfL protein family protein n=1 Tax=Riemerella columbipharyngis TaxID=1071918 RepID=A0A1G7G0C5_9FLAO|nr:SdpI family protein [Riemerella columbipharyngis]SDE81581.1 SdpI/YhfL protein family protein [Riemerella columbipharyngis]
MSKEVISILVFDLFIVVIPLLLYLYPPKEINYTFGYRTKRSVMNIDNWNFSQIFFAKRWLLVSVVVILTQLVIFFTANINLTKEPPVIPIISMIEFFIGSIFCYFSTENQLKRMNNEK